MILTEDIQQDSFQSESGGEYIQELYAKPCSNPLRVSVQ